VAGGIVWLRQFQPDQDVLMILGQIVDFPLPVKKH